MSKSGVRAVSPSSQPDLLSNEWVDSLQVPERPMKHIRTNNHPPTQHTHPHSTINGRARGGKERRKEEERRKKERERGNRQQ
jgi:hypothetical protein